MTHRLLLPLLLLAPAPAAAVSPIAQIVCAPTAQMTERLKRQYGERRLGQGIRSPEQVMELWGDERGDWTLVLTYATGQSCIVAMGEAWEAAPEPDPA